MKLSVVIPAYNEINTIEEILLKVQKVNLDKEIIIVDDGSTDGTKEFLMKLQKSKGEVRLEKTNKFINVDNVKFHVDTVKELGTFIEIEAIDKNGELEKEKLLEQCEFYLNLFNISKNDLVSVSYSDLILKKQSKN